MTTNDVSDTRISDERLERIAASDVASMGEAQRMARELLASRHPQPVNEPGECTCEMLPPGFHMDTCPQHKAPPAPERSKEETVVKAKPLLWKKAFWNQADIDNEHIVEIWESFGAGHIQGWIEEQKDGKFYTEGEQFDTLEAAKAAVQIRHERIVLSALETPPFHKEGDHIPATSEGQATCDDCAGPVISWRAPDALWNRVMGGPDAKDDPGGIICPNCFIQRAELAGVVPAAWLVDAPQPAPSTSEGDEEECCFICHQPLKAGDMVLADVTEGLGHRACFGEDREGYVKDIGSGEPLGPDDPIPTGWPYEPPHTAPQPTPVAPVPVTITPEMVDAISQDMEIRNMIEQAGRGFFTGSIGNVQEPIWAAKIILTICDKLTAALSAKPAGEE